jgi:peptide/nickel transport system permease protein
VSVLHAVLSQRSGAIGVALVTGHVALALLSPVILPHDPIAQNADMILQAPSLSHPFGTDRLGRDILSRAMLGGREAMLIATLATLVAMI